MRAVTLNYRDLAIARGHYHVSVEPPLIPISDGAGEVVAVGREVMRVRVGELACPTYLPDWIDGPLAPEKVRRRLGGPNDGVLAEFVCVHEQAVVRAPAHLEAVESAAIAYSSMAHFVRARRWSCWGRAESRLLRFSSRGRPERA
jgi:NADPH:quinone reductase-like Zn-dependent oxidoreductase